MRCLLEMLIRISTFPRLIGFRGVIFRTSWNYYRANPIESQHSVCDSLGKIIILTVDVTSV